MASGTADGMLLCLFDGSGGETRVPMRDLDAGIWHAFVPGVGPGQAYGYRATGPYDPARGVRCNPAKLLTDPYALAITGQVHYGPEVLGYAGGDPDQPSEADSAGHVPRSLVIDGRFSWSDRARPSYSFADTVVYEVHVKGFTMRHPGVPQDLRGTYAGLAHDAATSHLVDLGSPQWSSSRSTTTFRSSSSSTGGSPIIGATTPSVFSLLTRPIQPPPAPAGPGDR